MKDKTNNEPVGGYRFQDIGLDRNRRNKFLSECKLNNRSGSEVIKYFMEAYSADARSMQEEIDNIIDIFDRGTRAKGNARPA